MLDESLLLSFAKKFFEYIGNSDQIVMEKEVVILNAMKFGDIQDFNELIEVIGVAFLQEVYYFNSIKFNKNTLNYLLSKVDDEKKYEFKNSYEFSVFAMFGFME